MKIMDFLPEKAIVSEIKHQDKEGAIEELLTPLVDLGYIKNREEILKVIMEREDLGSTGIGQGIAVPHAKSGQVKEIVASVGLSSRGVNFDALDEEPVHILFLVLAPSEATGVHLKALARIARLLKDKIFRNSLIACKTKDDILRTIREEDERLP